MTTNSTSASGSTERIVWIDCEMTGLNLQTDALIEVAAVVTDSQLTVLGEGVDVVITPPVEALEQMDDFVRTMHRTSGLLEALPDGTTMADATAQVMDYLREWVPEPGKAPLAGNSVGTDRMFLEKYMPQVVEHLHYRVIDVSSIKELARRWYPRVYFNAPEKNGGHRALADILESIDELRYYREALFVPQPGPDSATAKQIAERVQATSVAPRSRVAQAEIAAAAAEREHPDEVREGADGDATHAPSDGGA